MKKHIRKLLDDIERKQEVTGIQKKDVKRSEIHMMLAEHDGYVQGLTGKPCTPPSHRRYHEEWIKGWKEGDAVREEDAKRTK